MIRLAMYVSFVDESGKGGPIFVVGGFTAKADPNWLAFSDEWAAVLDTEPALPHFHLSDQQGLSDENHWKKIDALIDVINKFVERGDILAIHVDAYKKFFYGKLGKTHDNPFHTGYVTIFQLCGLYLPESNGLVRFVFDDMTDTEYLELLSAYRTFRLVCPDPAVRARFGKDDPIRQNDEQTLPLQATDLFAGLFRRAYEDRDVRAMAALERFELETNAFVWDTATLEELFSRSDVRTPGLAAGLYYEDGKRRSTRLKPWRKILREQDDR